MNAVRRFVTFIFLFAATFISFVICFYTHSVLRKTARQSPPPTHPGLLNPGIAPAGVLLAWRAARVARCFLANPHNSCRLRCKYLSAANAINNHKKYGPPSQWLIAKCFVCVDFHAIHHPAVKEAPATSVTPPVVRVEARRWTCERAWKQYDVIHVVQRHDGVQRSNRDERPSHGSIKMFSDWLKCYLSSCIPRWELRGFLQSVDRTLVLTRPLQNRPCWAFF